METLCRGKKIKLCFFPLNSKTTWFHGVGLFLGKKTREGDEDDVDSTTDKITLVGVQNANLTSSNSDRVGRGKEVGLTDESKDGGDRQHGEVAKSGQASTKSFSEVVRWAKMRQIVFPYFRDHNIFSILSETRLYETSNYPDKVTGWDQGTSYSYYRRQSTVLGQAQHSGKGLKSLKSPTGPTKNSDQTLRGDKRVLG